MSQLVSRLQGLFSEKTARMLARSAPITLLATGAGLTLAALIAMPSSADTAAGLILGGIAINFTSSLVEKIAMLPIEAEDERAQLIEQGLRDKDSGVTTLVAAALTEAGPALAQALPANDDLFASSINQAMNEAGGSLARIAPQYIAALQDPQADWAQIQAALRQTLTSVSQTMEASKEGVISGSEQQATHATGPVSQVMRATDKGRIENSSQVVNSGNTQRCPDCNAPVSQSQRFCNRCGKALM